MDELVIDRRNTGDSDSEDDELEVMKTQDEDSEVRLPNGEAVYEKFQENQLKIYISECTIWQEIKWQRLAYLEDMVDHYLYSVAPLSKLSIDNLWVHCQKMNQEWDIDI